MGNRLAPPINLLGYMRKHVWLGYRPRHLEHASHRLVHGQILQHLVQLLALFRTA